MKVPDKLLQNLYCQHQKGSKNGPENHTIIGQIISMLLNCLPGVLRHLRVRLGVVDGHVVEDLLNVGLEAHVDHPVGLVEHDVGAAGERQVPVRNPSGYRPRTLRPSNTGSNRDCRDARLLISLSTCHSFQDLNMN